MEKIIELKAQNKEEAIEQAKKNNDLKDDDIFEIEELEKSKSILGIIKIKSKFKITIKGNRINIIKEKTLEILELMGIQLEIEVVKKDNRNYLINLHGKDNGIIIGKKGKTLNSFEFLLNALIKDVKVEVDVEGFKEKRIDTLRKLGVKVAEKVIYTQKAVKLNPMPPKERKTIHEVLNGYSDLETYSEGKDPKRYIVVKLKKIEE